MPIGYMMNEREFKSLKVGDFVRDPERGKTKLFIVEGKRHNRLPRLDGSHRYITIREYCHGETLDNLPTFVIQNAELESWQIVSKEEVSIFKLLYEGESKHLLESGFPMPYPRKTTWR